VLYPVSPNKIQEKLSLPDRNTHRRLSTGNFFSTGFSAQFKARRYVGRRKNEKRRRKCSSVDFVSIYVTVKSTTAVLCYSPEEDIIDAINLPVLVIPEN